MTPKVFLTEKKIFSEKKLLLCYIARINFASNRENSWSVLTRLKHMSINSLSLVQPDAIF